MTFPSTARFCCGGRVVFATYLGSQQWSVADELVSNDEAAFAICRALGLVGSIAYDSVELSVESASASGTIRNNTFPTDRWFVNLSGSIQSASIRPGLPAAITCCLETLHLPARDAIADATPLDPTTSSFLSLQQATDRATWAQSLARKIVARLQGPDPSAAIMPIITELRALGHPLWSWDESDDFTHWGYDYMKSAPPLSISLRISYPAYEDPTVEITVEDKS